jgi:NAD(P)-dependent dehydrogenase (short-subunit alcohol dehydrogenase family)
MEKLEKFGGQTPVGRPGQPAELGSIYVQLAAADASYATGQIYGRRRFGSTLSSPYPELVSARSVNRAFSP